MIYSFNVFIDIQCHLNSLSSNQTLVPPQIVFISCTITHTVSSIYSSHLDVFVGISCNYIVLPYSSTVVTACTCDVTIYFVHAIQCIFLCSMSIHM